MKSCNDKTVGHHPFLHRLLHGCQTHFHRGQSSNTIVTGLNWTTVDVTKCVYNRLVFIQVTDIVHCSEQKPLIYHTFESNFQNFQVKLSSK